VFVCLKPIFAVVSVMHKKTSPKRTLPSAFRLGEFSVMVFQCLPPSDWFLCPVVGAVRIAEWIV